MSAPSSLYSRKCVPSEVAVFAAHLLRDSLSVAIQSQTLRFEVERKESIFECNRLWLLKKSFNRTPFDLRACCCRFVWSAFD
jgi:hypothetical protein